MAICRLHAVAVLLLAVIPAALHAQPAPGEMPPGMPPGQAQVEPQVQPGAATLTEANATATPAQMWRDVQIVWLASQLYITPEQAKSLIPFFDQLQKQLEAGRVLRGQLWQEKGTALNAVIAAWCAGNQPDDVSRISAEDAAKKGEAQAQAETTAAAATLDSILMNLSEAQRAQVETNEAALRRVQAQDQLEGAASAADYVMAHIEVHRELTPEEYALLRHAEAGRVAARLVGSDSASLPQMRAGVLRIFDQVANWNDDQLAQAMPNLPDRIRDVLQLANDQPSRAIHHDAVAGWVQDARTPKYLAIYGTPAQALAPDADAKPDELTQALDRARLVTALNALGLNSDQLTQLATLAAAARAASEKARASKDTLLATAGADLAKALPYLITGQRLDEQWSAYLTTLVAKLAEEDDALNGAMIPLLESVRRVLGPRQGFAIDWRLPPSVAGVASVEDKVEQAQQDAAQIQEAIRLVEGLRPLIQTMYLQLRIARVEEFVGQYVPQQAPFFERLRDSIADQITEVRGLEEEQWNQIAPEVGVEILNTLGQLIDRPWEPGNRPLDWLAIRDLLADPQTGTVLKQMLGG